MARKKKHPEHVNHERWLVSYADFITLLFAFFVVMFAVSQVDSAKVGRFVESVSTALNTKGVFPMASTRPFALSDRGAGDAPVGGMLNPPVSAIVMKQLAAALAAGRGSGHGTEGDGLAGGPRMAAAHEALAALAQDRELAGRLTVKVEERGTVVSLMEVGLFDSGSAAVREDAVPLLDRVASAAALARTPLRFEGHTDSLPPRGGSWAGNWELSAARALSVLHHFEDCLGFDGGRLSASALGEAVPLGDNATAEGRARNRRVDIVLLSDAAVALESPVEASSASPLDADPDLPLAHETSLQGVVPPDAEEFPLDPLRDALAAYTGPAAPVAGAPLHPVHEGGTADAAASHHPAPAHAGHGTHHGASAPGGVP